MDDDDDTAVGEVDEAGLESDTVMEAAGFESTHVQLRSASSGPFEAAEPSTSGAHAVPRGPTTGSGRAATGRTDPAVVAADPPAFDPPTGSRQLAAVIPQAADFDFIERTSDSFVIISEVSARAHTQGEWPPAPRQPADDDEADAGGPRKARVFTAVQDIVQDWLDSDQVTVPPTPIEDL